MNTLLFLCTGNYYRSRFAEAMFNSTAAGSGLGWRAKSRGLAVGRAGNVGPISQFALNGLVRRGVPLNGAVRFPLQVEAVDLETADLIVAVKEAEHRPMLAERFPEWAARAEYWHVDDLDCAGPKEALDELEREVTRLASKLLQGDDQGPESRRT